MSPQCLQTPSMSPPLMPRTVLVAQVQLIQFSPEENYLVTFSSVEPSNPRDPTTLILNIFDVKTGAKLRNFQVTPEDVFIHPGGLATNWPIFKWAGGCDDKYAAPCWPIRARQPFSLNEHFWPNGS